MDEPLWGQITDVPGVLVGQAQRIGDGWLSGVTVVLPPPGTIGAVDVRGGGPGTHETDALDPTTLVPTVDAVTLTGGSAFGLVSAHGVQRWCEEHGRGYAAGPLTDPTSILVPIVPAAAIFDLGRGGNLAARPDAELGYQAAVAAAGSAAPETIGARDSPGAQGSAGAADTGAERSADSPDGGWSGSGSQHGPGAPVARGSVGAGTGARMAMLTLRGGVGTASIQLPGGVVVGALVVVNALGSPFDQVTGTLLGTAFIPPGLPRPTPIPPPDPATDTAGSTGTADSTGTTSSTEPATFSAPPSSADRPPTAPGPGPGVGVGAGLGVGPANTTLAVVATNAALTPAQARRTATAAHDGIARALSPAHTMFDGDTIFTLATGQIEVDLLSVVALQAAAADAVVLAILDAVLAVPPPT